MPSGSKNNGGAPGDGSFEVLLQDWVPGWFDDIDPILITVEGKLKTIELPGDRFIFTGPGQKVTLTNVDTGESATFGITGSFHQTTEDGNEVTVSNGRSLLTDPVEPTTGNPA
jgi:hypothetical protein